MNILVIGGTRYMGRHLVNRLISNGHTVTIATRGNTPDNYGNNINRLIIERTDENSIKQVLSCKHYNVVFDSLAYCSKDVKTLLDNISCDKYIIISSTAVYDKHINIKENEFNPLNKELIWCERYDFPYSEVKMQAECALFQKYRDVKSVAVRFPFVLGTDDYTNRLFFYVEHIIKQKPVFIDNFDKQMSFIRSDEAGKFIAFFAENDFNGPINGASQGTISIKDIADYIESKTGKKIIMDNNGDIAPYNGENEYSINTDRARSLGYEFSFLKDWIYELIDIYIYQSL